MALQVFAFYNGLTTQTRGFTYLQRYGYAIDELGIFEVSIQNDGSLSGVPSRQLIDAARNIGIKVYLVVSNLTPQGRFSTALMSRLFRDQDFANRVLRNIRDVLGQYRLDGVNFDLERTAPQDRNLFTRLIRNWTNVLKRENYTVSLDAPAKTSDDPTDVWKGAFDYGALGQIVDFIILMTYEEHWPGSPPGSVASLPWVNRVLDYALTQIPASKIYMGIPLYGYDWVEGGGAQVISRRRALEVARRFGAPLQWDSQQRSTFFRYESAGRRHTVYFEDLRSLREKLDLAVRKNIKGIAIWEMNLSYPEFWQALNPYI
ncbi:MAG: glycosyl hydrolase family 18 protein [Desulfitobacterium hafniense]|nr:glycosyl hydrolase family 18 protein [Desulfitobacterium hafniense]